MTPYLLSLYFMQGVQHSPAQLLTYLYNSVRFNHYTKKNSEVFKQLLQTHSAHPKIATVTFNAVKEFLIICSCKLVIVLLGTGGKQAGTISAMCHTPDCFQTHSTNSFMGVVTVVTNTIITLHGFFLDHSWHLQLYLKGFLMGKGRMASQPHLFLIYLMTIFNKI